MKPDRSTLGGFEHPSEGWHSWEIGEDVGFMKGRDEDGKPLETLSDTVSFPCEVIESEEKGRRTFVNCDLSKKGGRTALARFLHFCKVAPILEKEFNMNGDCNEIEWGEKYLNPDNEKCVKVVKTAISKSSGKTFDGEIKHSDYKGKTYANVVDLAFFGKGGSEGKSEKKKADKKGSSEEESSKSSEAKENDVGDW